MCIAILNKKEVLSKDYLKNSWQSNPQGGGLLYSENSELKVFKTFDYSEFEREYYSIRQRIDSPIVLHFRIATSGYSGTENLHPFLISQNIGLVHNGIFGNLGDKQKSDTRYFADMLSKLPKEFLGSVNDLRSNDCISFLIEQYVTDSYSKVIFLDNMGNYWIVNEKRGIWEGDSWFSNDGYLGLQGYAYYGHKKVAVGELSSCNNSLCYDDYFDDFSEDSTGDDLIDALNELGYYNVNEFDVMDLRLYLNMNDEEIFREVERVSFELDTLDFKKIVNEIFNF